jgi:hypothetical protein
MFDFIIKFIETEVYAVHEPIYFYFSIIPLDQGLWSNGFFDVEGRKIL